MAKSENQKLKLLYILKILKERTDESHGIPTKDLIEELSRYEITAERKSIYRDIEALNQFGYDIVLNRSAELKGYSMASRDFELPELKLLVDAVCASKFITEKKSMELVNKLNSLCSRYDAVKLQRQVYILDRAKSENEKIYYTIDIIHEAIQQNSQIEFQYYEWNAKKEMAYRHDGRFYKCSPYLLIWNDSNYYLVAYDETDDIIKHFRVDKMVNAKILKVQRNGQEQYKNLTPSLFSKASFHMFGGDEISVTFECDSSMAGVLIDQFGKDVYMREIDNGCVRAKALVVVSNQFYGWLTGLNGAVKVVAPTNIAEQYKLYLQNLIKIV